MRIKNAKKIKIKNKLEEKEERIKQLEVANNKKRKEIKKRIEAITAKKEEYEKEKEKELEKEREKREEKMLRTMRNKERLRIHKDSLREEILTYQNIILGRGINKENLTNLKRANAHEKTVVQQMSLEKNLAKFTIRMNQVKSNSVLKKSLKERWIMFKELKRKEAEKKRKEEEDKQNII